MDQASVDPATVVLVGLASVDLAGDLATVCLAAVGLAVVWPISL